MKTFPIALLLLSALVAAPLAAATADATSSFTAAGEAYGKGDYAHARELFADAEKQSTSPALEYNFGNACYQAGDYGAAVLHYLRALSLDPHDPDARQNLALARKNADVSAPAETWRDSYGQFFSQNTWAWIATVAGWATIYLMFLPRLFRWRGALPWLLGVAALLLTVAGGVGVWTAGQHAHDGVFLKADSQVKLSPTANSPSLGTLQPGEMAQILDKHDGYYKVQTSAGLLGWVDAADYAPVWE